MKKKNKSEKYIYLTVVVAAVLFLLGAALYFIQATGMRFSGVLLMAAGVFIMLLLSLRKLGRSRRWAETLRRALLVAFALGLVLFAVMEGYVLAHDETDWEKDVSAVIVLGAGVNGRVPSLSLQKRLEATLDYIEDKPDIPIVVTGGQGRGEETTEARCMADWLIARGVAEDRIVLEEQATDTEENLQFSLTLLAEMGIDTLDNIAVVSSDYHLARARLLWGPPYNVVPVAAHMPARFWPLTVNYYVREAFGVAYTMLSGFLGG